MLDTRLGTRLTDAISAAIWQPVVWTLAALYADLVALDLLQAHVAPWFTTVVPDAPGLRDFGTGCLVPPT